MASAPIEFQQKLTLRHIASVKTIQMLWRQSDSREDLKKLFHRQFEESKILEISKESQQKILSSITAKFEGSLEKLNIPGSMKNDLSIFLEEMIAGAVSWLIKVFNEMILHEDRNCSIKMEYFVDNISWDDVGWIDAPSIIHSYVNTKDTIDFKTWNELCLYCIEEDIYKFSKTVDWDNCREFANSFIPIFWYRKIYGEFPAEKMFKSREYFLEAKGRKPYDESYITRNSLIESIQRGSRSTVKYFTNQLTEEKFEISFENNCFARPAPDMIVDLLSGLQSDISVPHLSVVGEKFPWLQWPWVLFIDIWIPKIEHTLIAFQFRMLFQRIHYLLYNKKAKVGIVEFKKRQSSGLYDTRIYEPFRKLWGIFYKKFGIRKILVKRFFMTFLKETDDKLVDIMREGLKEEELTYLSDIIRLSY